MERAFLVTKESKYYKDLEEYINMVNRQKKFVKDFFKNNNINAEEYVIRGDGSCNCPFGEYDSKEIQLSIVPSKEDLDLYKKQLTKIDNRGLCRFKANSKIAKLFAQECIENEVIINILSLDLRDYFKIDWIYGYSFQRVPCQEGYYLNISSEGLKEDDNPVGFMPIKLSEFYKKLEEYKED